MIIRVPDVADAGLLSAKAQTYAATMYPELIPDIEKIHWLVRDCTHQPNVHYSRVMGKPGEPTAAILTRTENNLWAMKKHASVVLWYSEIPGAGAALLRGFRNWVKTQKHVVMAGFNADWVMADARPLMLAHRIGFTKRGEGMYVFHRGGSKWPG